MRSIALSLALATAIGIVAPAVHADDNFTAADVLGWEQKNQNWYFQTSVSMAGIVASQNPTNHAECINDWYFKSDEARKQAHTYIRETMQRFPNHHPGTAIIAVLEKICGSFDFTK